MNKVRAISLAQTFVLKKYSQFWKSEILIQFKNCGYEEEDLAKFDTVKILLEIDKPILSFEKYELLFKQF